MKWCAQRVLTNCDSFSVYIRKGVRDMLFDVMEKDLHVLTIWSFFGILWSQVICLNKMYKECMVGRVPLCRYLWMRTPLRLSQFWVLWKDLFLILSKSRLWSHPWINKIKCPLPGGNSEKQKKKEEKSRKSPYHVKLIELGGEEGNRCSNWLENK